MELIKTDVDEQLKKVNAKIEAMRIEIDDLRQDLKNYIYQNTDNFNNENLEDDE
jgi:uncharacterized protein (UPF0335 family)